MAGIECGHMVGIAECGHMVGIAEYVHMAVCADSGVLSSIDVAATSLCHRGQPCYPMDSMATLSQTQLMSRKSLTWL